MLHGICDEIFNVKDSCGLLRQLGTSDSQKLRLLVRRRTIVADKRKEWSFIREFSQYTNTSRILQKKWIFDLNDLELLWWYMPGRLTNRPNNIGCIYFCLVFLWGLKSMNRGATVKKKSLQNSLAIFKGKVQNNAFYFTVTVNGSKIPNMMFDTGAFELTFNAKVAAKLGLPKLGVIKISGVAGSIRAYLSRCNLTIGKVVYRNVPCIIIPQFRSSGLFGLRFFVDQRLKLEFNPHAQTLLISPA